MRAAGGGLLCCAAADDSLVLGTRCVCTLRPGDVVATGGALRLAPGAPEASVVLRCTGGAGWVRGWLHGTPGAGHGLEVDVQGAPAVGEGRLTLAVGGSERGGTLDLATGRWTPDAPPDDGPLCLDGVRRPPWTGREGSECVTLSWAGPPTDWWAVRFGFLP